MFILFYRVVLLVIFIDQVSKYWIRAQLEVGESLVIWEGVLNFTHIQNSGAAFGLFEGYGRLFIPVAFIITLVCIYALQKGYIHGRLLQTGIAMYVGGAIGNAIDRILFNQVTDFIHFSFRDAVPNLADYALILGIVLIFVDVVVGWLRKKRVENHS
ncbi:signal peptidase II [Virgibacillus kimchii]